MAYGNHLYLVYALCDVTILRHIHVSKPTAWRSLTCWHMHILIHVLTPLILCVNALNINYQRSKLGYHRKIDLTATTQQFITAKISGCALKQGSKTQSSLRLSNLQRQNEAALIRGEMRLHGARDKNLVSRPHVRTWALTEVNLQYWRKYLWHFWDFSVPPQWFGALRSDSGPP